MFRADALLDRVHVLKWGFFKEIGMIKHDLLLQSVYLVVTQTDIQFPFASHCKKVNVILVYVIARANSFDRLTILKDCINCLNYP